MFAKEQIKQAKYDENSTFVSIVRKNDTFWKKRKQQGANGFYNKDNDGNCSNGEFK